MLFRLFLFLSFISILNTSWDDLFSEEDPSIVHRVNVITGHLNFSKVDTVIQGPVPFPFLRNYSSHGALEKDQEKYLYALQNSIVIQGGWNFLSGLHLLIEREYSKKTIKAYLEDIEYIYHHTHKDHSYVLAPSKTSKPNYFSITSRNNTLNPNWLPNGVNLNKKLNKGYEAQNRHVGNKHFMSLLPACPLETHLALPNRVLGGGMGITQVPHVLRTVL